MLEARSGLLDTSVVINFEEVPPTQLPQEAFVSAITLAELSVGPHTAGDLRERATRQHALQQVEANFDPLPFDANAAREYGKTCGAVAAIGRKARGRRSLDLLIAAAARAERIPLYTRNPSDFEGLEELVEIVPVG